MSETQTRYSLSSLRQQLNVLVAWLALILLAGLSSLTYLGWDYPVELLAHFRVQYIWISVCLPFVFWQLKNRWAFALSMILLAWGCVELVPWYLPRTQVSSDKTGVNVLLANMLFMNPESWRLQTLLKNESPDIVVLMEIHDRHQTLMKNLIKTYPYFSQHDSGVGGVGVWSKIPLNEINGIKMGPAQFYTLFIRLNIQGKPLEMIATHPAAPTDQEMFNRRNQEFQALNAYLKNKTGRHVLLGDLNVTPWSPHYRQLIQNTQLTNGRLGFGIQPTWPTELPPFIRIPLDQVLISPGLEVHNLRTGPELGSDHLPLQFKLIVSD